MRVLFRLGIVLLIVNGCLVGFASGGERKRPLPRVFSIRPHIVADAKLKIRNRDKSLQPAVNRLRLDAAEALAAGPFSVVRKALTPPSGDKHDYYSLAPYWWPDPKKPDGLPYIRRDGEANPVSRTGTDLRPFAKMASSVKTLVLAFYLTDEKRYAEHASKLLREWFLDPDTRMNPHLKYGQAVPGRNQGRATGIIETRVLVDIVDAVGLLESSNAWNAADQKGMADWCNAYLEWLLTSEFGRIERNAKNNHGTFYDAQVVSLALFVDRNDIARKVLEASKQRRIAAHISPDGRQPRELIRTRSFGYSVANLRGLFILAGLGERVKVDLWHYSTPDGRNLRAALDYIAPYANHKQNWPHQELDLKKSRQQFLPRLLHQAYVVYGNEKYRRLLKHFPANELMESRIQLLYAK